jgi:hypothetical protein
VIQQPHFDLPNCHCFEVIVVNYSAVDFIAAVTIPQNKKPRAETRGFQNLKGINFLSGK